MAGIPLPVGTDFWLDLSFVRRAGSGRLVVAYAAATIGTDSSGNEDTGCLEVVVYDDANPPQPGTPIVIESELVTAAKILARPDGTLDLFYGFDCVSILHRVSKDGGLTWSNPSTVHASAGPVVAAGAAPPYRTGTSSGGFGSLIMYFNAVYAHQVGLFYLWYLGESVGGVHSGHRIAGSLDADGETWNWTAPIDDIGVGQNPPLRQPQSLRDGSLLMHSREAFLTGLNADGDYLVRPSGSHQTTSNAMWLDEQSGLWCGVAPELLTSTSCVWHIQRLRMDSDGIIRVGTNAGGGGVSLPGWGTAPRNYPKQLGQIGVRRDSCWEFLFAQPSGELDFKRCPAVPLNETGSSTQMVWS